MKANSNNAIFDLVWIVNWYQVGYNDTQKSVQDRLDCEQLRLVHAEMFIFVCVKWEKIFCQGKREVQKKKTLVKMWCSWILQKCDVVELYKCHINTKIGEDIGMPKSTVIIKHAWEILKRAKWHYLFVVCKHILGGWEMF